MNNSFKLIQIPFSFKWYAKRIPTNQIKINETEIETYF